MPGQRAWRLPSPRKPRASPPACRNRRHPAAPKATALRLLDTLPLLASLTEAEKQALAETMTRKTYQKGEVLVEAGRQARVLW